MEIKGHTETVLFDRDFISIERKGFLARASVGKGSKRIPLASVTAVQWKPAGATVNGFIQFTLSGGNERRSRFGSQTTDAASDENSVVFTKKQMGDFEELRAAVESAIVERSRAGSGGGQVDVVEQLEKLARLRDAGVVTSGEFDEKKAALLAKI